MREFKNAFGDKVDLDDPHTYDHLPNDAKVLDDKMFTEIGYALCYMNNFHPNVFKGKRDGSQRKRVMKLIENFCNERKNHYDGIDGVLWVKEQVYIFQDETENMC